MNRSGRARPEILASFATSILEAAGFERDQATVTAGLLVEADMMGHDTHGLALLPSYVAAVAKGEINPGFKLAIVADAPAVACWDGEYLPGLWLTARALDAAAEKATNCGSGTITVRRSGHIGCLAAFLPAMADRGLMAIIASSDPSGAYVAPYGGREATFSPNPIAVVIPTESAPIIIDISASTTTVGMTRRLAAKGSTTLEMLYLDASGRPSNDPAVMDGPPPGSILPAGGTGHGHKGYGLAIMIEGMTQALSGFGRADRPTTLGASTFVQVLDPAAFGGLADFVRQSTWLADTCRASAPRPEIEAVRMPGDQAMRQRRRAIEDGVLLHPGILDAMISTARKLDLTLPATILQMEEAAS